MNQGDRVVSTGLVFGGKMGRIIDAPADSPQVRVEFDDGGAAWVWPEDLTLVSGQK